MSEQTEEKVTYQKGDAPNTIQFTTEHGFKVVLREWITTDQSRQLMKVYSEARMNLKNIDTEKKTADIENTAGLVEANLKAQDEAITLVVVSINGDVENILDTVLRQMPSADGTEIIAAVESVTNPEKKAQGTSQATSQEAS